MPPGNLYNAVDSMIAGTIANGPSVNPDSQIVIVFSPNVVDAHVETREGFGGPLYVRWNEATASEKNWHMVIPSAGGIVRSREGAVIQKVAIRHFASVTKTLGTDFVALGWPIHP